MSALLQTPWCTNKMLHIFHAINQEKFKISITDDTRLSITAKVNYSSTHLDFNIPSYTISCFQKPEFGWTIPRLDFTNFMASAKDMLFSFIMYAITCENIHSSFFFVVLSENTILTFVSHAACKTVNILFEFSVIF